ncbi:MAG TPA: DUF2470 domain-containing protein [Candidatus Nitrosotenuis sp.]|jgi:putative heme iron utilization protein|nr:DUF2470 domain-containing protein [Candidatus Nitrosotenuis sp.]
MSESPGHLRPEPARQSPLFLGPQPSHAEQARTLVASCGLGALATLALDPPGHPYSSLVQYAEDEEGHPILLTSDLAEHTRNFLADPRASLLVAPTGEADPLARGRVTLLGRIEPLAEGETETNKALYLQRHPEASLYVGFRDFHFYRLRCEAVRYIGGFGRMSWVDAADYRAARPDPLAPFAAGILRHVNRDHAQALLALCRHFARAEGSAAEMLALDRYGFEMRLDGPQGPRRVRLGFPAPVATPEEVRQALVAMVQQAREGKEPDM